MTHRNRVSKYLLSEIGNNKRRVAPNFQLVKIEKINALFAKPNKAKHSETRCACAESRRGSTPPQFTPLNLSFSSMTWEGVGTRPTVKMSHLISDA